MRFASQAKPAGLALLVNHDDDAREIAYASGAEKSMQAAKVADWTVVSVKNDWSKVFVD